MVGRPSGHLLGVLEPLSLRFIDESVEREYRRQTFLDSLSTGSLLGWGIVLYVATSLRGQFWTPLVVSLFAAWVALHKLPDKDLAQRLYYRCWGVCNLAVEAFICLHIVSDIDARDNTLNIHLEFLRTPGGHQFRMATGAQIELIFLFACITAISLQVRQAMLTHAPRLCVEAVMCVLPWVGPSVTPLGKPLEPLFVLGTVAVVEVAGYYLERSWRLTYVSRLAIDDTLSESRRIALELEGEAKQLREELLAVLTEEAVSLTLPQLDHLLGPDQVQHGLAITEVHLEKRAGSGSFATVYRARYRGGLVALKQPHARSSERDLVRPARGSHAHTQRAPPRPCGPG